MSVTIKQSQIKLREFSQVNDVCFAFRRMTYRFVTLCMSCSRPLVCLWVFKKLFSCSEVHENGQLGLFGIKLELEETVHVLVAHKAFHKLLGNFLATSGISSNLFLFRTTFCTLSNFQFSTNSEILEQFSVLKLALLPYFTMFYQTIYVFPVKKESDPPPGADHGRKMHAAGLLGQRFLKKIRNSRPRFTLD